MGVGWLVIVIGFDFFNMIMMIVNVGGFIGKILGSFVVFSIFFFD